MPYIWRMVERDNTFLKSMPALARAQRVTDDASRVGFDWITVEPVWKKVEEELEELKTASASGDGRRVGEEMGDLLLSLVNLSRFLAIDAEDCLGEAVSRFQWRFAHVEAQVKARGKTISDV